MKQCTKNMPLNQQTPKSGKITNMEHIQIGCIITKGGTFGQDNKKSWKYLGGKLLKKKKPGKDFNIGFS